MGKQFSVNLDEDLLRAYGFTDYDQKNWYYVKKLDDYITINITIPKNNPSKIKIDVLDEFILQPYDFMYYDNKKIKKHYKEEINKLIGANILKIK